MAVINDLRDWAEQIAAGGRKAQDRWDSFLGGVTAGTAAASRALVLGANRVIDFLDVTALSIGGVTIGASPKLVTLTGDTTIVPATHEAKLLLLGEVGGDASLTVTLPAATGSGARYRFMVSVVNTSNYVIQVVTDDIMQGQIVAASTGDSPDLGQPWVTANDSDTITLNGTTLGGVSIGDWIELVDILADTWAVSGQVTASGTELTPFSAGVS